MYVVPAHRGTPGEGGGGGVLTVDATLDCAGGNVVADIAAILHSGLQGGHNLQTTLAKLNALFCPVFVVLPVD